MTRLSNEFWTWPWWALLILGAELLFVAFVALLLYRLLGSGRLDRHSRLLTIELEYQARVRARAVSREADELWSNAALRRREHQVALWIAADRMARTRPALTAVTQ